MGSVRKTVPSCSSLKALSFLAGITQRDPETAKNDRLSIALGATSLLVGCPLDAHSEHSSPTGSFEPDCRRFCTIFSVENAYLAFCMPFLSLLQQNSVIFVQKRPRERPEKGPIHRRRLLDGAFLLSLFPLCGGGVTAAALRIAAAIDPFLSLVCTLNVRLLRSWRPLSYVVFHAELACGVFNGQFRRETADFRCCRSHKRRQRIPRDLSRHWRRPNLKKTEKEA